MAIPIKRRKLFYPLGEQKLGLLTQGKEWMLNETRKEYKGPYHRFTDGVVMTGGQPSKRSKYLIPYKDLSSTEGLAEDIYRRLTKVKVDKFVAPRYHYPKLGAKELEQGYVERYFVQKKNERTQATITEINKDQYEKVTEKNAQTINGKLHDKFLIRWKILGTEKEITEINKNTLVLYDRKYKGVRKYLGVLTEFSKFSPITSE